MGVVECLPPSLACLLSHYNDESKHDLLTFLASYDSVSVFYKHSFTVLIDNFRQAVLRFYPSIFNVELVNTHVIPSTSCSSEQIILFPLVQVFCVICKSWLPQPSFSYPPENPFFMNIFHFSNLSDHVSSEQHLNSMILIPRDTEANAKKRKRGRKNALISSEREYFAQDLPRDEKKLEIPRTVSEKKDSDRRGLVKENPRQTKQKVINQNTETTPLQKSQRKRQNVLEDIGGNKKFAFVAREIHMPVNSVESLKSTTETSLVGVESEVVPTSQISANSTVEIDQGEANTRLKLKQIQISGLKLRLNKLNSQEEKLKTALAALRSQHEEERLEIEDLTRQLSLAEPG